MLSKGLQNYTNSQHKFLHMGSTPPPFTQCVKIHPIWQMMASLSAGSESCFLDSNGTFVIHSLFLRHHLVAKYAHEGLQ